MKLPSDYLKQGWCQFSYARNSDGTKVGPQSPDAVAWDHFGAASKAFGARVCKSYVAYVDALESALFERYALVSVSEVNDIRYDPVTGQDRAIEDAMEAERRAGLR